MGQKNSTEPKGDDDDDKMKEKEEKEKVPELPPTPFFSLFRYSSRCDKFLIVLGCIAASIMGSYLPALIIFMSQMLKVFIRYDLLNLIVPVLKINRAMVGQIISNANASYSQLDKIFKDLFQSVNFGPHSPSKTLVTRLYGSESDKNREKFVGYLYRAVIENSTEYTDEFKSDSVYWSAFMGGVAMLFFVTSYIMVACLSYSANSQAHRIRKMFFKSVMRQDITWFDTKTSGDFATKVTADLSKIQDGIGEKVALCIFSLATFVCSIVAAFIYGWKLTLVILSVMPVLVISFSIIAKIQARMSTTEAASYSKAGAVAEEVLGAIRTVFAFGGQTKEIERYDKHLQPAKKSGIKRIFVTAIGVGVMWLCIYCAYGLAFWYGVKLITDSIQGGEIKYDSSNLMTVFFCVLMGAFSTGQASPYFEAFAQARGAATLVFEVIERVPIIDSSSNSGEKIENFKGEVEFQNVHFRYPARDQVKVLEGLHLIAAPGETVALVGPSGCGKSTVIQLIQRFYDVEQGQVFIDGKDIRDLNVGWLRDQIGVVGQEPVLFGCSIAENIKLGFPDADQRDIEVAARDANAHDFIMRLPQQYHTLVGERGSQLSGGQKQRIAIARALIRRPKILLLDESTSALDLQSESIVQAALDKASIGRTTFIVAHRLSTIRAANKIIVIENGKVREIGTHEELMSAKNGLYFHLVQTQAQHDDDIEHHDIGNGIKGNVEKRLIQRAFSVESAGDGRANSIVETMTMAPMKAKKEEKESAVPFMRLVQLLTPDKLFVLTGVLTSIIMGLSIPGYAIIFGEILKTLSDPDIDKMKSQTGLYSSLFVTMGIISGLAAFFQIFMFGISGERLTQRLRKLVFQAMLRQEIAWFDDPKNSTGALCSRLSADAASVQGASGSRISTLCQAIATLAASISIALYYNWKLGLVLLAFVPIVIIATYFQMLIISGQTHKDKDANEESTKIAVEAISSIRTVASLHQEISFFGKYVYALETQFRKSKIRPHLRGFTFGIAQSMGTFAYAVGLFYGSRLILNGELDYGTLFKVVEAIIFGTSMVGQAVAFAPDYQKGKIAAIHIFQLLDRIPKIILNPSTGEKPEKCNGTIQFRDVYFNYPTRENARILRGLSFQVSKGQTVAIVGSSGCGKSTCIQLIERFYDNDDGEVCIDGKNIVNLNIPWLRSQLGIVSQEPVLFGYSIGDNIAYGDNSRFVELNEIIAAAQKANIHNFIKELPMGYDTPVGDKGTQISGGQKQRIAIARALLRNPEILLLDEATSALDSESEKVVQSALDEARQGRTCIVIAHRLSTIQNADKIVVIHKGKVIEEGTHHELIASKGSYFQLYNVQSG